MARASKELFELREVITLHGRDRVAPQIVDYVDPVAEAGRPQVIVARDAYWEGYQPDYWKTISFWASRATQEIWQDFRVITYGQLSQLPRGERTVLDFCGGDGNNTIYMARQGEMQDVRFVIADKAVSFLEEAQRRVVEKIPDAADRVALHRVDATRRLPYENETFNAAMFNFGSPYFGPEERQFMYDELRRVLRRGGKLIESTFVEPVVPMPELGRDMTLRAIRPWAFPLDILRMANTVRNIPVLRQFEKLKAQGASAWPSAESLGEQHREAGFSRVDVVRRLTHNYKGEEVEYGAYLVAQK